MAKGLRFIVESINPPYDSKNIPTTTSIEIVFKNHMDVSTLNQSTVRIFSEQGLVACSYTYVGMDKKLTIKPLAKLKEGMSYSVQIKTGENGPKTAIGEESIDAYNYSFETSGELIPVEPEAPLDPVVPVEPEDPVSPIEPPVKEEPIEDIFESFVSGLVVEKSYPERGSIFPETDPIVLLFSKEVNSEDLIGKVFVKARNLHPLLELIHADKLIKLVPEVATSRRHIFVPETPLVAETEYEMIVRKGIPSGELVLEVDVRIDFQTNWNHLYATVADVRLALGLFGDAFTDSELNRLIHQQSVSIFQLMSMRDNFVEDDWVGKFPYAAGQYVLYKTAYQAVLGQVLESSSGVRQSIKLADLSVSDSESTSKEIKGLLELLKEEIDKWWNILLGKTDEELAGFPKFTKMVTSAVRAGRVSEYPEFTNRVPFKELGGN